MHQVGSELYSDGWWQKLEPWERQFDDRVAELEHELIAIRRHLRAHPEPSGEELETSKFVAATVNRLQQHARFAAVDLDDERATRRPKPPSGGRARPEPQLSQSSH